MSHFFSIRLIKIPNILLLTKDVLINGKNHPQSNEVVSPINTFLYNRITFNGFN